MFCKPKMTSTELIKKMKEKGITFDAESEEVAKEYLQERNNYFRIASYRKNYEKRQFGENKGKYINLDFAYLSELAKIDMHLRFLVIKMCLDIEHFLKVQLLSDITDNVSENGYDVVKNFLNNNEWIKNDIFNKRKSNYVGDLINKNFIFEYHTSNSGNIVYDNYEINCPVWAFMEIIGFGEFIKFYEAYYEIYPKKKANKIGVLNSVKSLRNACAHNNCVIHDLRKGYTHPPREISVFVSKIDTISKSERIEKLKIRPLLEMTSLLYLYENTVPHSVKTHRYKELDNLVNSRMLKHAEYFGDQQIIKASYKFLKKVVDFLI